MDAITPSGVLDNSSIAGYINLGVSKGLTEIFLWWYYPRTALFSVSKISSGATGDKSFDQDGMQVTENYVRYITKVVTEAGKKKLAFVPYKK